MMRWLLALPLLVEPMGLMALQATTGRVEGAVHVGARPAVGAVVFLDTAVPRNFDPPELPAVIDQVDLRFVPQVVAVLPGTTVAFPNSDPILHNVFSPGGPGRGFDLGTYPPGEARSRRFLESGIHVILCHVHPEMVAYVAVVPTPYHAVVDEAGRFAMGGVPEGRYKLKVWLARRVSAERELVVRGGGVARVELQLGG